MCQHQRKHLHPEKNQSKLWKIKVVRTEQFSRTTKEEASELRKIPKKMEKKLHEYKHAAAAWFFNCSCFCSSQQLLISPSKMLLWKIFYTLKIIMIYRALKKCPSIIV